VVMDAEAEGKMSSRTATFSFTDRVTRLHLRFWLFSKCLAH